MATPANYANLIAEIDAIVDDYALTLFQVSGGKSSNLLSLFELIDLRYKLFEAGGAGGPGTIVLSVFRATGAGTGYSINDIIILRQTPPAAAEYFNATTGLVIATPDPANLGSVSSASNVSVTSSVLPTGAATSALQSAPQADAGSDASKAIAIQGVAGGKSIPVVFSGSLPTGTNAIGSITNTAFIANAGTNLNTSLLALESGGNLAGILAKLPSSVGAKVSTDSLSQANAQAQTTLSQLTAPSSSAAVSMAGYSRAFITVLVANINTNVVVRIEGSNDGINWTNLSTSNTDTTITTNGCYGFVFVGCPASIRATFVSEAGGSTATIDVIVRVSA